MSEAASLHSEIVITAAAVRTALGDRRSEIVKRVGERAPALARTPALEASNATDAADPRTFACAGGPIGPDRAELLLAATLADALTEAELDDPVRRGNRRIRLVVGTTLNGMRHVGRYLRGGPARDGARLNAASVASIACERCGLHAAGITISTACASGITAIGIACDLLRSDEADVIVAGGYDPVSEFSHAGFGSLRLLAGGAPRPFARDRDGMRTAEGYALLVLERADDARQRGAWILARVAAVAESSDAFHLTQPHPEGEGAASAVGEALSIGGMPDLLVAHATGTEANDGAEARAYERAFGASLSLLPVTAPKSALGHTLGAAGAVDAALCIGMAEVATMMPTVGDPGALDPSLLASRSLVLEPTRRSIRRTMNVALGFGGSNAALVLEHRSVDHDLRDPRDPRDPHDPLNAPDGPPPIDHAMQRAAPPRRGSTDLDNDPIVVTGWSAILPGAAFAGDGLGEIEDIAPGEVDEALLAPYLDARSSRRIAPISRLVRAATRLAIDDARLDENLIRSSTAFCATQHGAIGYSIDAYRAVVEGGLGAGNPLLFAESVPNVPGAQCSLAFGLRGAAITVIGSRLAFIEALWLARSRMRAGRAERVIVVTAEERHHDLDRVLVAWRQTEHGQPVCTSGAAAMVLERASDARRRAATPRAVLGAIHWDAPACCRPGALVAAARCVIERLEGSIDAPARPGLLGRLERRAVGARLGATLGAEASALGPALLALRRAARGDRAAVLALDSFGAAAAFELLPASHPAGVLRTRGAVA